MWNTRQEHALFHISAKTCSDSDLSPTHSVVVRGERKNEQKAVVVVYNVHYTEHFDSDSSPTHSVLVHENEGEHKAVVVVYNVR